MWEGFVELIRVTIFGAAHVCGESLGGGILLVSLLVRLALLPTMLRLARRAREQHAKLAAIGPQLERLRKRFAKDPAELWRATRALHQRHGIPLMDPRGLLVSIAQIPLLTGLFSAVRSGLGEGAKFLWIGNLARPDAPTLLVVAALTAAAGLLMPKAAAGQPDLGATLAIVSGIGVLIFLSATSSAVALSIGAGSAVTAMQNAILRREATRAR
jgi:YidC/Oxa1 family membrane protein insertase